MFLETICIKNGIVQEIEAHRKRMRQTALHFGFSAPELPDLSARIPPELAESNKIKCSVVYHKEIISVQYSDYRSKTINSLKLVEADLDYSFKYSDRATLKALLQERGDCDEILIVKDNRITDTSFSNVVFRKENDFFTPNTYLLNGIKRQKLLLKKRIRERPITVDDLRYFDKIYLINAMLDIEDGVALSVEKIL